MPTAESAGPAASRQTRMARAQATQLRGSLDGRIREASPVPLRDDLEAEPAGGSSLFVSPDDPGVDAGYDFWFDTDDVVG